VLNRLYIVVGVVAILVLLAAFVAPVFMPWSAYRLRFEQIATEVAGAPVTIGGDIRFALLPEPTLEFNAVTVGAADGPEVRVARVAARFSLMDFLTDRYTVNELTLDTPQVALAIAEDGGLDARALGWPIGSADVSIAAATISHGAVRFADRRNGGAFTAEGLDGTLKRDGASGLVNLQLMGTVLGVRQAFSLSAGGVDAFGEAALAMSLRNADTGAVTSVEGVLSGTTQPNFTGTLDFRQPPPRPDPNGPPPSAAEMGRGDLTLAASVTVTADHLIVSDYTLLPDENRTTTRLTGAARVNFGVKTSFDAVVSGGVVTLPPLNGPSAGSGTASVRPWELMRLFRELPGLPHLGMPGEVTLNVTELGLRGLPLRKLAAELAADAGGWTLKSLSADLPGGTHLTLAGRLDQGGDGDRFAGRVALNSKRLDLLSALYRKPAKANPLFNRDGALSADLALEQGTLRFASGQLRIGDLTHQFTGSMDVGTNPSLTLGADLGTLDDAQSAALAALLPDIAPELGFGATFQTGKLKVSAKRITLAGLGAEDVALTADWAGGVVGVTNFSARDWGGASVSLAGMTLFGALTAPDLSGRAVLALARADAPALRTLAGLVGVPADRLGALNSVFPARLELDFAPPNAEGTQAVDVTGTLGSAALEAGARFEGGFFKALLHPFDVTGRLTGGDLSAVFATLGFEETPLFSGTAPVVADMTLKGQVGGPISTGVSLQSGREKLSFDGQLSGKSLEAIQVSGTISAALEQGTGLAALAGAGGISLPGVTVSAAISYEPDGTLRVNSITGEMGGAALTGTLARQQLGGTPRLTGDLSLERADAGLLLALLAGPAALVPDGPLDLGPLGRGSEGRVGFTVKTLSAMGRDRVADAAFDLTWDRTSTHIRRFAGQVGSGTLNLDLGLCCAGSVADKELTLRFGLDGVPLAALLSPEAATTLSGSLSATGSVSGVGASLAALENGVAGSGSVTITSLGVAGLDPAALVSVTDAAAVISTPPETLQADLERRLGAGLFAAPMVSGAFSISGGLVRVPNLGITGDTGQLFGNVSLRLADLGLGGSLELAPRADATAGILPASLARATLGLGGSLTTPRVETDLTGLIDALLASALEAEAARLERLRAEDEARKQAAAEEAARMAAEAEKLAPIVPKPAPLRDAPVDLLGTGSQ
jgi:hypothetical protein